MTLREKINDILEEARKDDYEPIKYLWRTKYGSKSVSQVILDCVKESMPKKNPENVNFSDDSECIGWNAYRTEMLRILEQ